jgi:hypothetical protein
LHLAAKRPLRLLEKVEKAMFLKMVAIIRAIAYTPDAGFLNNVKLQSDKLQHTIGEIHSWKAQKNNLKNK